MSGRRQRHGWRKPSVTLLQWMLKKIRDKSFRDSRIRGCSLLSEIYREFLDIHFCKSFGYLEEVSKLLTELSSLLQSVSRIWKAKQDDYYDYFRVTFD